MKYSLVRILVTLSLFWPLYLNAALIKGSPPAEDFSLNRADGGEFRLSEHKGRVVLLYFGFTHCPHVCPQTMGILSRMQAGLSDEQRKRLDIVFISVDPDRDTPERVTQFLDRFSGEQIGLIPTEQQLDELRASFRLTTRKILVPGSENYDMVHTDFIYSVDHQGRLRHAFFSDTPVGSMLKNVKQLLDELP